MKGHTKVVLHGNEIAIKTIIDGQTVIICAEWEPPFIIPLGQIEDLFAKQNIVVSEKDQFVPLLTNIFQGSALIHTI